MTCAACDRILTVDDEGYLPNHQRVLTMQNGDVLPFECVGSHSKGHPHRMELPDAPAPARGFTFVEFVDEPRNGNRADEHVDRNLRLMTDAIEFLCAWLGPQQMPTDDTSLIRAAGHANNVQHAAMRLLSQPATRRVESQRRAAG